MSEFLERVGRLSPKRLALLALELNEQVEAARRRDQRAGEALAVVGMACRFPGGADDPGRFWSLLDEGRDAIRQVPAERWDVEAYFDPDPEAPGSISVRHGGFLDRIDGFDASFFGISPREAITMDPQQRLLLEVAWEALENAAIAPESLAGSSTGVYVGICNGDHFQRVIQRGEASIDAYLASGNAHSVAAGRISYFLGLQGPALAIDTACSSSLVALHVACQSLRSGECGLVLVGGINLMCSPETSIALTKAHMLAPDGRCKAFDAAADGFSRGEGCGVLVLKRLSDALAEGDPIHALIRGTAANQDGRSGGLTVPNGPAQEAVIRAALANAGVAPAEIDYVEAHGTGTALGDPIEVRALAGALGGGRPPDAPLLIGSVKTNIGHLESAAGVAGVIKVILSLMNGRLAPHLHYRQPSRQIDWSQYPVAVVASGRPWPRGAKRRLAGVSSFGFSGTNAHVVMEEAPPPSATPRQPVIRPWHCLALSARSDAGLRTLAASYAAAFDAHPDLPLPDAAHTAGVGRSHFTERLAVVARDNGEAARALTAFSLDEPHPALHRASASPGAAPEVVFLFTGQGAQYPGMSRLLYESAPVFRQVIDRCDELLGEDGSGRRLLSVLHPCDPQDAAVHETAWTQPALFAVEYGLTQLWRSWGIEPAAVIGHSVGEYVAACVAGVFTLEEGLKLIAARGRLMQQLPGGGSMAAVFAPAEEVAAAVAPMADRLAVAAINAADSVVISGESAAVDALLADFAHRDVQGHRLFVSLAAHSPLVEPALAAMEACARTIEMRAPRIPIAWNLTGGALPAGTVPDAVYWRRHLREPVRFADGIADLHRSGFRTFLEVGPHPTLVALAQRSLPPAATLFLTSLRRGKDDWNEMIVSLAELYVHGAPVDWAGVDRPYGLRRVPLPSYPFERRSFWIAPADAVTRRQLRRSRGAARSPGRQVLGERLATALPVFESTLTPASAPYLSDHRVCGCVVVAGPVLLETAQLAAQDALGSAQRSVHRFEIRQALALPEDGWRLQTVLVPGLDGRLQFRIHGRPVEGDGEWQLHAVGDLVDVARDPQPAAAVERLDLDALARRLGPLRSCEGYYDRLGALGIALGPSFRSLQAGRWSEGEALATVALPASRRDDAVSWAHPSLMDGALQAVGLAVPDSIAADEIYLLTALDAVELREPLPDEFLCHAILRQPSTRHPVQWEADVTICNRDGVAIGTVRGVRLQHARADALAHIAADARRKFDDHPADGADAETSHYQLVWEPVPATARAAALLKAIAPALPRLRERFDTLAAEHGLRVYEELLPQLDRLCAMHVATALRELHFDATPGRVFIAEAEAARLGVLPRHARLFVRLLDMLVDDGVLRRRGGGDLEIVATLPQLGMAPDQAELLQRFGDVNGELLTLRRCGPQLARVLRGEQDPLQLLFPDGSFAEARQLYVDSPYARTYNGILGQALQGAIASLPAGNRLRILEIGAGTGGTTGFVLPLLPADGVEYTFTDLSPIFLERAAERFAEHRCLRCSLLDIERSPLEQGFEAGGYDIVIAANVLHATADLRQSLKHARSLLAPQGMLFLLEGVAPERWVDLSFGLTEGWWRFTDTALRPAYPLVSRQTWVQLLEDLAFADVAVIPDDAGGTRGGAQQALIVARSPRVRRCWTVLSDRAGIGEALAARLRARGEQVVLLPADQPQALRATGPVVYLGALDLAAREPADPAAPCDAEALACLLPMQWLQQIVRFAAADAAGPVWLVTRAAQSAGGVALPSAQWQAPLWGIGRVFALEQPRLWGGLVDLPPEGDADALARTLVQALDGADLEDQTAWRDGARFAARLLAVDPLATPPMPRLRADGTYLVTGGYGGLGMLVARWLAQQGAGTVALLGRHGVVDVQAVQAIEALGARVIALQADVADEAAMAAVLARLEAQAAPLRGVVHAAAHLGSGRIEELTSAQVTAMLRPKLRGTVVLERLTRERELDFLVFFSSTTALLGASGFAHYAAANAFLDAMASRIDRRGRRVLSVNWGTWESMRLASDAQQRSFREGGLQPMPAAQALDALARLLVGPRAQEMVARIDWCALKPLQEARRPRPLLSRVGLPAAGGARPASRASVPLLQSKLLAAQPGVRLEILTAFVREQVAAVLGIDDEGAIPPGAGLFELGMDSLMSVELKRRLEGGAGRSLPSTLTFNYPNVMALAGFLDAALKPGLEEGGSSAAPAGPEAANRKDAAAASLGGGLDELSDDELEARLLTRLEQSS